MSAPIEGFIIAIVLAILVIAFIAYCMFCREKHKPEYYQYDISDIKRKNIQIAQEQETKVKKKELTAGIFILPSRRKHDDYEKKRPDYPESPTPVMDPGVGKLVEVFNDNDSTDAHYRDGILEIDSHAQYHSEV